MRLSTCWKRRPVSSMLCACSHMVSKVPYWHCASVSPGGYLAEGEDSSRSHSSCRSILKRRKFLLLKWEVSIKRGSSSPASLLFHRGCVFVGRVPVLRLSL